MKISELSVRRPVLITMIYVIILIVSALYLSNLQIALYPSVDMPVIAVMVDCNDAGPEEIEQQVSKVLENNLGSIENLNTMTSQSSEGRSIVSLEFDYGTDLDTAKSDVDSVISTINGNSSLPDWADSPQVFRFDRMSNSSFMRLVLTGDNDLSKLKNIAENDVSPLLLRISGVSQVEVRGTGTKDYEVNIDPIKLASYGLTLTEVKTALAAENVQNTEGSLTQNNLDYSVTIDERFMDLDDIRQTVVSTIDNVNVTINDIATVSEGTSSSFQERYRNGEQVVTIQVSNESGTNSSTIAKAVRAKLDSINSALPKGIVLSIQEDSTKMINSTMNEVYSSAVEGVLLAALFIFLFLRNIKATLIISLSMPVSILIT
ncbi:MAG: efflux RND transporter permease subunit [Sphaerochaetaceae bacterium]